MTRATSSPEHVIHLRELLGHFGMVWPMLMATVIHAQEVGNQQLPLATIDCATTERGRERSMKTCPFRSERQPMFLSSLVHFTEGGEEEQEQISPPPPSDVLRARP